MTIGVFDSGVGGTWILKHIREAYPEYDYIFVADQAHVPYGLKSMDEIRNYSEEIVSFLKSRNCQIVVVACNTASSAALNYLREKFPDTLFVGMEPAIKPALESSKTGKVGVLATKATLDKL
jgi:glutamate racemase